MFGCYRVAGEGMWPTLKHRAIVVTLKVPGRWLRAGMIVVAQPKQEFFIVKRVEAILDDQRLILASDNGASRSAYCGVPLRTDRVVGIVCWRLPFSGVRPATNR